MEISEMKIFKNGRILWRNAEISWMLNFRKNESSLEELNASEMAEFRHKTKKNETVCKWRGHKTIGRNFEVTVVWKNEDGLLSGSIEWKGGNKDEVIEQVSFPVISIPMPKTPSLYISRLQGILLHDIDSRTYYPDGYAETFSNFEMQYNALISPSGSYYFDTRDTEFYIKTFDLRTLDNHSKFRYSAIHPLPLDGKSQRQYRVPYSLSTGFFKGGWFEAAQIYKKWAREQKWAKRPPVDERLRNTGMWIWNRGNAEDVITPVEKLSRDSGVPVSLDWYWWHQHGYDTSYPYYWPPREGLPVFKKALSRLKKQNIFTQVYMNGVTWDMDAEHWEKGGSASVVVEKDGNIKSCMFNRYAKKRLAWMCGNDNIPFRGIIRDTIKKLNKAGLSGIYLDMIGCSTYSPCYNQSHKHAPGGGNYQVAGYRKMLEEIISENPGFPISTEEANEAYMDLVDSAISLSGGKERLGAQANFESVPAFSAVYHGITAMFGNYALPGSIPPFDEKWPEHSAWKKEKAWHKLYPDQFFVEVGRSVVWGLQPTVANLRNEHTAGEFSDIYDFLVSTARFYHAHRNFLFDGDMLAEGVLKTREIEVEFLQRFIFTEEGKQKVVKKKLPSILHSLWRGRDASIGLVLVNCSRETQQFDFESPFIKISGEIGSHSWMLIETCENRKAN